LLPVCDADDLIAPVLSIALKFIVNSPKNSNMSPITIYSGCNDDVEGFDIVLVVDVIVLVGVDVDKLSACLGDISGEVNLEDQVFVMNY
jgi:hypothetical protein